MVDIVPGLKEHSRQHVPFASAEDFETTMKEFFQFPDRLVYGEETATQARNRFSDAVGSILAKYQFNDVALVTHGTVMTLFTNSQVKIDPFRFWRALQMPSLLAFKLTEFSLDKIELDFT